MQTWTKIVTTRKPHICWGCGYEFKPGTEMEYITNIDGGAFIHSYWCPICRKVIDMIGGWGHFDDGVHIGDIKSNYPDEWGMVYADTVSLGVNI